MHNNFISGRIKQLGRGGGGRASSGNRRDVGLGKEGKTTKGGMKRTGHVSRQMLWYDDDDDGDARVVL